jgi:hypothetical protein
MFGITNSGSLSLYRTVLYHYPSKVLSSENKQVSILGSKDRHYFSVVVLDIIFNF